MREAERVARELRARLLDPDAALPLVPDRATFRFDAAGVLVDPPVAEPPEPPFDPEAHLDVLALERLRRADHAADAAAALAELAPLLEDRALAGPARAWIRARMAWIAHRGGCAERRDELLATDVGTDCADAAASLLLLRATVRPGTDVEREFAAFAQRASAARARALCDHLDALGVPTATLRAAVDRAGAARTVLRVARAHAPELATPLARVVDGGSALLAWPSRARGAVLDAGEAGVLCAALLPPDDAAADLRTAPFPPDSAPVVDGALAVAPPPVPAPALLAGPTGTALLAAALALVCGGGSFLAFRALRREAAALRLKTEFLTTVTHELKTPLAGVRLVAELLADDHVTDPDERHTWLGRLNAEAVRLGVLIENVLDLGRLDRGERPHAPRTVDVAELVAETVALFAPLAERDGIAVRVDRPDAPLWASIDADALRQALVNVLDNARKYGAPPLEVEVRSAGDAIEVAVRDHGPGIPPAEREAIFGRFRRGATHGHGSIPGVGLGLHLARAIAERHGGTLACDAPPGGGASFVFRIPTREGATR